MADDSGQEKTESPTQKRIDEAHERGEFARSKEITTVAIFTAMLMFLSLGQEFLIGHMSETARFFFRFDGMLDLNPSSTVDLFWIVLRCITPILLPLFAVIFFTGLGAEVGQIGFNSAKDPFEPKWDRLDPVKGFQRIFSLKQGVEGLKSTLKLLIFAYIAYRTIRASMPQIVTMNGSAPAEAAKIMLGIATKLGYRTCMVLALLAGFDYLYQKWQYDKNLRMSRQELKDEMKQMEGDPVLKARIRSIQMEIARKRMMTSVPESDVVITNPTHYAIALQYDPTKSSAPIVVAKGQMYLAQKIREVASEAGVPIVENPPLARAIYKKVPVGGVIPADLFKAVAQILASIWALSKARGRSWAKRK